MRTEDKGIRRLSRRSAGSSLLEYAMLGALITVTCYTAMSLLGGEISRIVIDSCTAISTAIKNAH